MNTSVSPLEASDLSCPLNSRFAVNFPASGPYSGALKTMTRRCVDKPGANFYTSAHIG